jgi:hypothetical protein
MDQDELYEQFLQDMFGGSEFRQYCRSDNDDDDDDDDQTDEEEEDDDEKEEDKDDQETKEVVGAKHETSVAAILIAVEEEKERERDHLGKSKRLAPDPSKALPRGRPQKKSKKLSKPKSDEPRVERRGRPRTRPQKSEEQLRKEANEPRVERRGRPRKAAKKGDNDNDNDNEKPKKKAGRPRKQAQKIVRDAGYVERRGRPRRYNVTASKIFRMKREAAAAASLHRERLLNVYLDDDGDYVGNDDDDDDADDDGTDADAISGDELEDLLEEAQFVSGFIRQEPQQRRRQRPQRALAVSPSPVPKRRRLRTRNVLSSSSDDDFTFTEPVSLANIIDDDDDDDDDAMAKRERALLEVHGSTMTNDQRVQLTVQMSIYVQILVQSACLAAVSSTSSSTDRASAGPSLATRSFRRLADVYTRKMLAEELRMIQCRLLVRARGSSNVARSDVVTRLAGLEPLQCAVDRRGSIAITRGWRDDSQRYIEQALPVPPTPCLPPPSLQRPPVPGSNASMYDVAGLSTCHAVLLSCALRHKEQQARELPDVDGGGTRRRHRRRVRQDAVASELHMPTLSAAQCKHVLHSLAQYFTPAYMVCEPVNEAPADSGNSFAVAEDLLLVRGLEEVGKHPTILQSRFLPLRTCRQILTRCTNLMRRTLGARRNKRAAPHPFERLVRRVREQPICERKLAHVRAIIEQSRATRAGGPPRSAYAVRADIARILYPCSDEQISAVLESYDDVALTSADLNQFEVEELVDDDDDDDNNSNDGMVPAHRKLYEFEEEELASSSGSDQSSDDDDFRHSSSTSSSSSSGGDDEFETEELLSSGSERQFETEELSDD